MSAQIVAYAPSDVAALGLMTKVCTHSSLSPNEAAALVLMSERCVSFGMSEAAAVELIVGGVGPLASLVTPNSDEPLHFNPTERTG